MKTFQKHLLFYTFFFIIIFLCEETIRKRRKFFLFLPIFNKFSCHYPFITHNFLERLLSLAEWKKSIEKNIVCFPLNGNPSNENEMERKMLSMICLSFISTSCGTLQFYIKRKVCDKNGIGIFFYLQYVVYGFWGFLIFFLAFLYWGFKEFGLLFGKITSDIHLLKIGSNWTFQWEEFFVFSSHGELKKCTMRTALFPDEMHVFLLSLSLLWEFLNELLKLSFFCALFKVFLRICS